MELALADCIARDRLTSRPQDAHCRSNARASGTHERPPKRSWRSLGEPSLRLGLLLSAAAHALLVFGMLRLQLTQEQIGPEPVIMVEFLDLAGPPGLGAAAGARAAAAKSSSASKVAVGAKSSQAPAAVNLADKISRQQAKPSQAQVESHPAQGAGATGVETSSTAGGPGSGGSSGAGSGSGGTAGGVSGGVAGGTDGGKLDSLPRIIEKVRPAYPEHARRAHRTGVVTLKFLVDAEGRVKQASVVEASPQGLFEESALSAIARWRFAPAMRQGSPVPTWLILPIRFTLER